MEQIRRVVHGDRIEYLRESDGFRHREDGPAVIWADGRWSWWLNGRLHCQDGPAWYCDGSEIWFLNGLRHRIGGPAVQESNGTEIWYQSGLRHCESGPAVRTVSGACEWYLWGALIDFDEWAQRVEVSDHQKLLLMLRWSEHDRDQA